MKPALSVFFGQLVQQGIAAQIINSLCFVHNGQAQVLTESCNSLCGTRQRNRIANKWSAM
ncbi:hypothetical protein I6I45_05605 [Pseudomonas fluorescens]|uniref:Uncharacterized protein n=1 Tax=Pseudomonas lactis TaxID=1615674 RepID=A0A7Y1MHU8_9PSED|nr:hypothetical protein [Pseudomonas lactis]NNA82071.1 hypothetical protein [Pseudomonas lactis]QQU69470.1 hypothetical protein I6I45_05605 [Pseudomonas fluorescens]TKK42747.1 hypothetical protein PflCFBP13517_04380 [Pseudomonas fluorescens]